MTIAYKKNKLAVDGAALDELAARFGTPLYCYSASRIRENFMAYHDALCRVMDKKDFTICYAMKANSNLAILSLLKDMGAGADIVSGGEWARAIRAGIPPSKIVFSGVGKSDAELEAAIRANICQINVEAEDELDSIARIAKRLKTTARVAIRVNPDVNAKTHAKITTGLKENKFGIDIKLAPKIYARAKKMPYVEATGIAVHIGSQLLSLAPYKNAFRRVAALTATLRKSGHDIRRIDVGGGLGIRYKDETPPDLNLYALLIRDIILPLGVHVVLEPGRSIVGDAGLLLSRVIGIKKGTAKKFLILDAAMNDLMRPALYDAYHALLPVKKSTATTHYDVVGPVCETGDTFHTAEKLPAFKTGDLAALMCAGAYGASMGSTYNTRPLPAEVLVDNGRATLIRKRQTVTDLLSNEIMPGRK